MDLIFHLLQNNYIRLKILSSDEINVRFFTSEQAKCINYMPNDKCVKITNDKEKTVEIIEPHEGNEIIITSVEFDDDHIIIVINISNKNLFEMLQKIPGTSFSIRIDKANTSTHTQIHAHILDSKGNDLYQVNEDGSTHHGKSKGKPIHKKVFEHLKQKGFDLNDDRYISLTIYEFNANYFLYELKQKIEEQSSNSLNIPNLTDTVDIKILESILKRGVLHVDDPICFHTTVDILNSLFGKKYKQGFATYGKVEFWTKQEDKSVWCPPLDVKKGPKNIMYTNIMPDENHVHQIKIDGSQHSRDDNPRPQAIFAKKIGNEYRFVGIFIVEKYENNNSICISKRISTELYLHEWVLK